MLCPFEMARVQPVQRRLAQRPQDGRRFRLRVAEEAQESVHQHAGPVNAPGTVHEKTSRSFQQLAQLNERGQNCLAPFPSGRVRRWEREPNPRQTPCRAGISNCESPLLLGKNRDNVGATALFQSGEVPEPGPVTDDEIAGADANPRMAVRCLA